MLYVDESPPRSAIIINGENMTVYMKSLEIGTKIRNLDLKDIFSGYGYKPSSLTRILFSMFFNPRHIPPDYMKTEGYGKIYLDSFMNRTNILISSEKLDDLKEITQKLTDYCTTRAFSIEQTLR